MYGSGSSVTVDERQSGVEPEDLTVTSRMLPEPMVGSVILRVACSAFGCFRDATMRLIFNMLEHCL
ncbi:hypothetical protein I545_1584 [Mycobacterium kansasii 662]|uniref:Uncharacterized protein n=2 Tax=Mycobacterium kansasii TaxID=1768 RepID=X7ZQM8_MYCKA|nr:hypothetical protein I545_1584 [Mycobacterium kansasii 662]KEP42413.1 hypothetical protein MKSMC1_24550 [Mycobacterium kansasii]